MCSKVVGLDNSQLDMLDNLESGCYKWKRKKCSKQLTQSKCNAIWLTRSVEKAPSAHLDQKGLGGICPSLHV